jgi:hypothetical protein
VVTATERSEQRARQRRGAKLWTPEQALAVYDLLHQFREKIWNHYQLQLIDLLPSSMDALKTKKSTSMLTTWKPTIERALAPRPLPFFSGK